MKKPPFLAKNDLIYLVSPSFGCSTEPYKSRLTAAIKVFEGLGYRVNVGKNCYNQVKTLSAPKEICGKEINDAFNSDAKVIMSVGGGETMVEILPFIDFSKITKPIWFVGFSDNANLTYTLTTICDIESIYAPCVGDFCIYPFQEDAMATMELLTGSKKTFSGYPLWEKEEKKSVTEPLAKYNLTEEKKIIKYNIKEKKIKGRLLGGCLDVLINLCGTGFDHTKEFIEKYHEDGIIWYIEACDLNVFSYRRAIHQLNQAGWFKYAKAFLIGRPMACFGTELFGINQYNAVTEVLDYLDVPIAMDVDLGHYSPMIPMINGARAQVEFIENDIVVSYLED